MLILKIKTSKTKHIIHFDTTHKLLRFQIDMLYTEAIDN